MLLSSLLRSCRRWHVAGVLLTLVLALSLVRATTAQTVYDDFPGSAMRTSHWWSWGSLASTSVAQSKLSFALSGDEEAVFTARQFWRGDFDFVVDFDSVAFSGNGSGGFFLTVFDAQDLPWLSSFVDLSIRASTTGRSFDVYSQKKGNAHGTGNVPTTTTVGALRVTRSNGVLTTYYRESATGTWRTLLVWQDFLTELVALEISAETSTATTFACATDKVTFSGAMQTSPTIAGPGCGGMRTMAWSLPYYGNTSFSSVVAGDSSLSSAPLVLFLGLTRITVDLTAAGAPGCWLLTTPDVPIVVGALDQEASAFVQLPLPNDANLVGLQFFQQFAAFTRQNALQLVFSNVIESRVFKW
ncbi:MAG: hypothetical protein H6833_02915 [Planctomycetes bacterium]|nr:hypothetical protein [Planctomycetota bacterium]